MDKLEYLYKNAKEISFDESSKLVFMSDVHRGDGTLYDDLLQNRNIYISALNYYYRNSFTYVEVGDGDELWKNKNYVEIAKVYGDVFELFNKFKNENRIYMIYGNHDIIKKRSNFYSKEYNALKKDNRGRGQEFLEFIRDNKFYEAITLKYKPLGEKFLVVHGHQVDKINYDGWMISRFLARYLWRFVYRITGFKDPLSPAINKKRGKKIDKLLQSWASKSGKMILCGHTHNERIPKDNKKPYFNDGCCILPFVATAIEIENGKLSLIKWSIQTNEEGSFYALRKIISGPVEIEKYLLANKEK